MRRTQEERQVRRRRAIDYFKLSEYFSTFDFVAIKQAKMEIFVTLSNLLNIFLQYIIFLVILDVIDFSQDQILNGTTHMVFAGT